MRNIIVYIVFITLLSTVPALSQAPRWRLEHFPDAPVITPGFQHSLDMNAVADPELFWDGEWFRLYYTGVGDDNVPRILLAGSMDLVNWFPGGIILSPIPGTFNENGVGDPEIVKENNRFVLYYTAERGGWKQIARIESEDGFRFEGPGTIALGPSYQTNRFDSFGVGEPSVVYVNGGYQMVYRGFDGTNWYRLGVATSTDGETFDRIVGSDEFGSSFGKGPHGFDDGGATEPEIWIGDDDGIRMLYTSLHY